MAPGKTHLKAGKSAQESGKSAREPGKTAQDLGKLGDEPGNSGEESGKLVGESGNSAGEPGNSAGELGNSGEESGKLVRELGKSEADLGKSSGELGNSGEESGKSANRSPLTDSSSATGAGKSRSEYNKNLQPASVRWSAWLDGVEVRVAADRLRTAGYCFDSNETQQSKAEEQRLGGGKGGGYRLAGETNNLGEDCPDN